MWPVNWIINAMLRLERCRTKSPRIFRIFDPNFARNFAPRNFRALFSGRRRPQEIHKNSAIFQCQIARQIRRKNPPKVFWRAGKVTHAGPRSIVDLSVSSQRFRQRRRRPNSQWIVGPRGCCKPVCCPHVKLSLLCQQVTFVIDLLMGLFRGAVFRHGGGALKQPIKQPIETPTSTLALIGRFPSLMGRFPTLMGRFTDFVLRGRFPS